MREPNSEFERGRKELREKLYHSAARDFAAYLWRMQNRSDFRSQIASRNLLKCGYKLMEQGQRESAKTIFKNVVKLCPGTQEAERAVNALLGLYVTRQQMVS